MVDLPCYGLRLRACLRKAEVRTSFVLRLFQQKLLDECSPFSIVLYLRISKAPPTVRPNQRRSHAVRKAPREKRSLKSAGRDKSTPVKIIERLVEERSLQSKGPTDAQARYWAVAVRVRGTKRSCRSKYRRGRPWVAEKGERI